MARNTTSTLTFLFTDIESSTELLRRAGAGYADLLDRHRAIIRAAVAEHAGTEQGTEGDSFFVTFDNPSAAVAAALDAQRGLVVEQWPDGLEMRVRMGIHLGEATHNDEGLVGLAVHHAARIAATGHGAQIVLSEAARIATTTLPAGADVRALGSFSVRDVGTMALYQLIASGLPADFPPLRVLADLPGNLPVELSTFVGRADELQSLVDELAHHRLVTLIGVGGTGKTRLAVETARAVSESFPDGCWMVELATVAVADTVPFAFAAGLALTAPQEGDVIGHLVARLRDKRVLIVVDNCEHLLAAAADAVERIVAGCPRAVVLVTSREPLMIRGERMVPVPPLSPEEAERLFLERARDEAPDLVIDAEQAQAVVELCRRLDGLPLALELAASRVRAFSPVELVTNLEQRFRMLVGGRRSRMQRHQTMRGTLDWSYDLCTEVEQTVFDRLSVFPASFDLAAARAIAGGDDVSDFDIGEVVPQLVDRSLLQRSTAPDGTTRYRMLETMRAYGRECLQRQGSDEWARCQHARYMAATIGPLTLRTFGPDERQVMQRLSEYLSDSLVALDWCIAHQEWENGLRVIPLLNELSERESNEMCSRLHDAALAGGAPDDLLDELAGHDKSRFLQHISQSTERGWRLIRDRSPIPVGWFASSPYLFFADGGLAAGDVDEFLDSLDRWLAAPPASRLLAEWSAVRALAHSGHLDRVEQPLSRLTNFATDLHSANANRFTDELHGTVARMRHDWPGAARWYAKVVESGGGRLNSWIDLAAAWHLLTARCLSPEDIDITGSELRDPWTCCLELRFDELRWHGATTTALALQRLEHPDLANRFAVWATRNDQIGAMSFFVVLLEIAGLPTRTIESNDNLDTLIEELFTIADDLELP